MAGKKSAKKKSASKKPVKKTAAKKVVVKKTAAKKTAARKPVAKKSPVRAKAKAIALSHNRLEKRFPGIKAEIAERRTAGEDLGCCTIPGQGQFEGVPKQICIAKNGVWHSGSC